MLIFRNSLLNFQTLCKLFHSPHWFKEIILKFCSLSQVIIMCLQKILKRENLIIHRIYSHVIRIIHDFLIINIFNLYLVFILRRRIRGFFNRWLVIRTDLRLESKSLWIYITELFLQFQTWFSLSFQMHSHISCGFLTLWLHW